MTRQELRDKEEDARWRVFEAAVDHVRKTNETTMRELREAVDAWDDADIKLADATAREARALQEGNPDPRPGVWGGHQ